MKIKVGIIGATGYVGIELVRLLQQHAGVEISQLVTESYAGQALGKVYPHFKKIAKFDLHAIDLNKIIAECELVFLALPHGKSAAVAKPLLTAGKKVIDLSADFRLRDSQSQPAVYGLPEVGYKKAIQQANLIANPGCYPTATILAAMPALKAKIVEPQSGIFDAKSGVSGSGRNPQLSNHFAEVTENLIPYKLAGQHQHTAEIEQELSAIAEQALQVQFTPHLVPMIRGLVVTGYFQLRQSLSQQAVQDLYQETYQAENFIRVCEGDEIPQVKAVRGSNYCDVGVYVDKRTQRLITISVIDNLVKGAAGQAVQNMNIMYGFDENMGLMQTAIYP